MRTVLHPLDDEADVELVTRHQAGDPAAFAELYERHHRRLVRFCDRLVEDPHLAEELAHDAFLRAYTSLEHLGGPRRFYPWIAVIARRLVIDALRKSARISFAADVDAGVTIGTEDIVVQRLDNDQVLVAMDRVRARHRAVLAMRDVEDMSYQQIADELLLPLSAVAPLLHRARSALRREYLLLAGDQVAALLPLAGLIAIGRRLRDRLALLSSWLPEPASLAIPTAVLTLGGASLFGAAFVPGQSISLAPSATSAMSPASKHGLTQTASHERPIAAPGSHEQTEWHHANFTPPIADPIPTTRTEGPRGIGRGGYGQQDREEVQDRARHMPYYFELGPAGIGWDPDDDRRRLEEFAANPGGE